MRLPVELSTGVRLIVFISLHIEILLVYFEVVTAVTTKSTLFWDVTPCSLIEIDVSEERTVYIFRI
jgi:hypothetical protein